MQSLTGKRPRLTVPEYTEGILRGERAILARAITLVESDLPDDQEMAAEILDAVLAHTGDSVRVGISGVPGVGKSTLVDALGMHLIADCGENVAVLSVDPSSPRSGGSILGDKTRMERLAREERAFIRPSPARGHLGGVARHTRETILLCEAAGYRNIIVETVGVGQSETAVRSMTDFFLLLLLPGAGDELQGIKRGILELIDGVSVNKADGDNRPRAEHAQAEFQAALRMFPPGEDGWRPPVILSSGHTGEGVAELWEMILAHREHMQRSGYRETRRQRQAIDWMRDIVLRALEDRFRHHPRVREQLPGIEQAVAGGQTSPAAAALQLLAYFNTPNRLE